MGPPSSPLRSRAGFPDGILNCPPLIVRFSVPGTLVSACDAQGGMPQRLVLAALVALLVPMSVVALDAASTPAPASAVTSAGRLDPTVFQLALSTARCAQQ